MGYREYFLKVRKRDVNPIRKMDYESLVDWCEEKGIHVDDDDGEKYINIHDLFRKIGAEQVFEFGKYYENGDEVTKCGKPLFKKKDVNDIFSDYNAHIVWSGKLNDAPSVRLFHADFGSWLGYLSH